nr:MAG TPA: hypothetical protein [Caudoviricetes sp.]
MFLIKRAYKKPIEQYIYKKYKVNTLNFNSLDTIRCVE